MSWQPKGMGIFGATETLIVNSAQKCKVLAFSFTLIWPKDKIIIISKYDNMGTFYIPKMNA
jgi:hypothetical protein